jgi:hypothetical protein
MVLEVLDNADYESDIEQRTHKVFILLILAETIRLQT